MARLLTGDSAAASKVAEQYLAARQQAKDPAVDYRRAQWMWISGRRKEALRAMEAFAAGAEREQGLRDTASRAWAEAALWSIMLGDRPGSGDRMGVAGRANISLAGAERDQKLRARLRAVDQPRIRRRAAIPETDVGYRRHG
jgi:hypothetical protein